MSDYLPHDLVLEILHRLPIQSLVKCTCVCKRWHSTITSPKFISTHLNLTLSSHRHRHHHLLLRHFSETHLKEKYTLYSGDARIATIEFPFSARHQMFMRVVGTIHGLLCLSDDIFGYTHAGIIWNPFVQRFVDLPPPLFNVGTFDEPYLFVLGFGFDSKKDDYKVVKLAYPKKQIGLDGVPPKAELYSLKERSWRVLDASGVDVWVVELFWSQCFLHGNVHWISYLQNLKNGQFHNSILVFNVEEEKFSKIKLPMTLIRKVPLAMYISLFQGCLSVLYYHHNIEKDNMKICDMWMMREYGVAKSWTKVYTIDLEGKAGKIIGGWGNGDILVAPNATLVSLKSFDPKSQEMRDLDIRGTGEAFHAETYIESLVLLDKEIGAIPWPRNKACVKWLKDDEPEGLESDKTDSIEEKESEKVRKSLTVTSGIRYAEQMAKFGLLQI